MLSKKNKYIIVVITLLVIGIGILLILKNNNTKEKNPNTIALENRQESVTKIDFDYTKFDEIRSSNVPTIITFGVDSCQYSTQMYRELKKMKRDIGDSANILYVDINKYPQVAEEYEIYAYPIQIFINSDGTPYTPTEMDFLEFEIAMDENDNIIYTKHVGLMLTDEIEDMLQNMQEQSAN